MQVEHKQFDIIPSTQDYAKEQNIAEMKPGVVYLYTATQQTKGRGTNNRTWASPLGNIYATYALKVEKQIGEWVTCLPPIVGLSVAQMLINHYSTPATVKWPNDVLIDQQKVCGILCECDKVIGEDDYTVLYIGIGVNVNMNKEQCDKINQPATSMSITKKQEFVVAEVISQLSSTLIKNLSLFIQNGFSIEPFIPELNNLLEKFGGESIVFDMKDQKGDEKSITTAKIVGLNNKGHLVLDISGKTQSFFTGRILRGKEIPPGFIETAADSKLNTGTGKSSATVDPDPAVAAAAGMSPSG